MTAMRVARRYTITGRVQGVGYRLFVADSATREGLKGHVRNLADGSVEVAAEGDREAVTRFEAALWRGPSRAQVADIVIEESVPDGSRVRFAIR